jgi:hypothetical protein
VGARRDLDRQQAGGSDDGGDDFILGRGFSNWFVLSLFLFCLFIVLSLFFVPPREAFYRVSFLSLACLFIVLKLS